MSAIHITNWDDKSAAVALAHEIGMSAEEFTQVADEITQAFARHRIAATRKHDPSAHDVAVDSGMDGESIAGAEAFWANLPTGRKWTSLKTHEKALVCHQMDRLEALFRKHDPSEAGVAYRADATTGKLVAA